MRTLARQATGALVRWVRDVDARWQGRFAPSAPPEPADVPETEADLLTALLVAAESALAQARDECARLTLVADAAVRCREDAERVLQETRAELATLRAVAGAAADAAPVLCAQLVNVNRQTEVAALTIGQHLARVNTAVQEQRMRTMHLTSSFAAADESESAEESPFIDGVQRLAALVERFAEALAEGQGLVAHAQAAGGQLQSIHGQVDDVRRLAREARIVALNAAVEAARAGEHGNGFGVLATEVRRLADRSELAAVNIGDVVRRLHDSIDALTAQVATSAEQNSAQAKDARASAETIGERFGGAIAELRALVERVRSLGDEVATGVSQVVVALQFQDITRQEIEHVVEPLAQLGRLAAGADDTRGLPACPDGLVLRYTVADERAVHAAVRAAGEPAGIDHDAPPALALAERLAGGGRVTADGDDLGDNVDLF
ncbi:MAG TPA: methyl-accepting chemotaxis protein [Gemmatimonadaceae bacterium]|nr:methyl-accepting chemotaxis protein [Gemmatimonadaceae bacterium]